VGLCVWCVCGVCVMGGVNFGDPFFFFCFLICNFHIKVVSIYFFLLFLLLIFPKSVRQVLLFFPLYVRTTLNTLVSGQMDGLGRECVKGRRWMCGRKNGSVCS